MSDQIPSDRSQLRRCALDSPLSEDTVTLSVEIAHYLCDVLRLSAGDHFIGFDGSGLERVYRLSEEIGSQGDDEETSGAEEAERSRGAKRTRARRDRRDDKRRAQMMSAVGVGETYPGLCGAPIALCFALPKGDKLDLVARQVTELGVSALHLWSAERSVGVWKRAKIESKLERIQRICREASRQSGRADELRVSAPVELSALIERHAAVPLKLYLDPHVDSGWPEINTVVTRQTDQTDPPDQLRASSKYTLECALIVGPEGGLSLAELEALNSAGWRGVKLSSPVLRTETAGVVASAIALDRLGYLA